MTKEINEVQVDEILEAMQTFNKEVNKTDTLTDITKTFSIKISSGK